MTSAEPPSPPRRFAALASFRQFASDFVRSSRAVVTPAAAFTILGGLTEGLGLMLLLPLVNVISKAGFGSGFVDRLAVRALSLLPVETPVGRLTLLLLLFAVVMAIRGWAIINRDILLARLQTGFVEQLRVRLVARLARADWMVLARLRHGRVSHVLSSDISSCGLAAQLTLQSLVSGVALIVQLALAMLLSPAVASIVLALLIGGALTLRPALRRSRELGVELTQAGFRLTDDTNQFLGGLKLAFSQNLQDGFADEYRQTVLYGAHREVAFARQRSIGQVALTSLAAAIAGMALLIGFGVFHTSPAALIALLIVLARMSAPAAQIQQNVQYIAHSLPAYEQILGLEADVTASAVRPAVAHDESAAPWNGRGDVTFDDVSFDHDAASSSVTGVVNLDFVLRQGETIGITGASGAGKTTLLDLLVGLLSPDHGRITVDGRLLDGTTLPQWQDRISYVSQDPYLFHDSIVRNLRWARPTATDADIARALQLAGADSLVEAMPEGLETIVGERGTRLSGGERQRIALARALIRNPSLLILDEATNAIDVAGEQALLARLAALEPRPTIVMVAHREQSLAFCERLLVLDGGRLV